MKYRLVILILLIGLFSTCNNANYITVKHRKPINHNRSFNKEKDKRKKRVKYVKVKILKQSKEVKPPKRKNSKEEEAISSSPQNEADSTGSTDQRR